jgi:RES domain-containing protein
MAMLVYRICKTKYANDLTGEGARLNGGRWNLIGTPCIYASESKALALLEYTVNANIEDIPRALSFTTFELPDDTIVTARMRELPGDWKQFPSPSSCKEFGTKLLKEAKILVLKIPSVVIPDEWNYIINPKHPDHKKIKVVDITDFVYDIRIKTK